MKKLLVQGLLIAVGSSACYCQDGVSASQVGLKIDSGRVVEVVGAGIYTDMGLYSDLVQIDTSAKTLELSDPDLVTSDKQPIGVSVAVTYARKRDAESVNLLWSRYNGEAKDDKTLDGQVRSRVPAQVKTVTAAHTLDELIGTAPGDKDGRPLVTKELFDLLKPQLDAFGIELLDVRFSNFAPDGKYLDTLKEKALVGLRQEISKQTTLQLEQQLLQEQAQTKIELEKARRTNEVKELENKLYTTSPQAYELEKLKLLKEVLGDKTIYFIPQGSDVSLFFSGVGTAPGTIVPTK